MSKEQTNYWMEMHYASGQHPMNEIRRLFRDYGFDLIVGGSGGVHAEDWGRLAGAYAKRHQGSDAIERWAAFRVACDAAGLYPLREDEDSDPWGSDIDGSEPEAFNLLWNSFDGGKAHAPKMVGDVGVDLQTTRTVVCPANVVTYLPTGVRFAALPGTWILLLGRSSTASKLGLAVIPGVIDNGYRGEMFAGVYPVGGEMVVVEQGTRVIQAILMPSILPNLQEVDELPTSARGENGFGSTGKGE